MGNFYILTHALTFTLVMKTLLEIPVRRDYMHYCYTIIEPTVSTHDYHTNSYLTKPLVSLTIPRVSEKKKTSTMAADTQERHRPGALKQQNKSHKHGKHKTKGQLERDVKGMQMIKFAC